MRVACLKCPDFAGGLPRRFPASLGKEEALKKQLKQEQVAALKAKFERARGVVITQYQGMTVAEMTSLRRTLRKSEIDYKVIKNTLARIASEGTTASPAKPHLKGQVGLVITYTDAAQAAKAALGFAKTNEKFKVMGGVIEGNYYDAAALKTIAALPPREVLLLMMAGTLQAPASKMARLLAATVARMGYALTALKDKRAAAA